jgi:hypothetical protein
MLTIAQVGRFRGLKRLELKTDTLVSDLAPLINLVQLEELRLNCFSRPSAVFSRIHGLQAMLSSCHQLHSLWLGDVHVLEEGPLYSTSVQELHLSSVSPSTLPAGMDLSGLPHLSNVNVHAVALYQGNYFSPDSICQLAHVLASWNVDFLGVGEYFGIYGPAYRMLSPQQSLAYALALQPLKAAEWPKRLPSNMLTGFSGLKLQGMCLSADVRHVLKAIFPNATLFENRQ